MHYFTNLSHFQPFSLCLFINVLLLVSLFLVANRGLWFEFFVMVFGGYSLNRKIRSFFSTHPQVDVAGLPILRMDPDALVDDFKSIQSFWCTMTLFVLRSCSPRSVVRPLFFHTLFLESRGLSKLGREVLAKQGLCQFSTTYRRQMCREISTTLDVLR